MKIRKPNKQLTKETRNKALKEFDLLHNTLDTKQNPNSVISAYNKKWSGVAVIVIRAGKITELLYK